MPIFDPFGSQSIGRDDAPRNALEITPSDADDLPVLPSAIWAEKSDGGPISLRVQMGARDPITLALPGAPSGPSVFPGLSISPTRIYATGTTATKIILFW